MHGLGNDFAIFEGVSLTSAEIVAFGDRRRGIGFDQLIILEPSSKADILMQIYNPDGSEAGACGNATRCVSKILSKRLNKQNITVQIQSKILDCFCAEDRVTVDMGEADLDWQKIPLSHSQKTISLPISVGSVSAPVAVGMGNPHAVFFVPDLAAIDIEKIGKEVEYHALFPQRTNVEFVQILSPHEIRMRVWERGAGVTLACGSGACAAAVAAVRRDLTDRKVAVMMDGGTLEIEWREADGHVLMTGPAVEVYRGEVVL